VSMPERDKEDVEAIDDEIGSPIITTQVERRKLTETVRIATVSSLFQARIAYQ
jgi:hypothetical protein